MQIGYIGLGKMGKGMAVLMQEKGHEVFCFNRSEEGKAAGREAGLTVFDTMKEMVDHLDNQKLVFIMVSHQGVDEVLNELIPLLKEGDTVIDGGNCFYKESVRRAVELRKHGINFLDIGVSGGPGGARQGACLMIGGEKAVFQKFESLFKDIAANGDAYKYLGSHGAGHFAKMVHNGIEYGMMQSIAEGFNILKKSDFGYSLTEVADLYQKRSVVESRLVEWLKQGFEKFGEELPGISGEVAASGEGEWTVNTAKEMDVPAPAIQTSLYFRSMSQGNPSYIGKLLSTMRTMFGGHDVKEK